MNFKLETKRLIIRELLSTDVEFIFELLNSEGWLKYIGNRNIENLTDAENYIKNGPQISYYNNGYGLWLVFEKNEQKSIGICGLIKRDYLEYPDIGFAFLPIYFGKGYAFEAAEACCKFAYSELKIDNLMAIVQAKNDRSIKLIQKLGFNFSEKRIINNEELDVFLK